MHFVSIESKPLVVLLSLQDRLLFCSCHESYSCASSALRVRDDHQLGLNQHQQVDSEMNERQPANYPNGQPYVPQQTLNAHPFTDTWMTQNASQVNSFQVPSVSSTTSRQLHVQQHGVQHVAQPPPLSAAQTPPHHVTPTHLPLVNHHQPPGMTLHHTQPNQPINQEWDNHNSNQGSLTPNNMQTPSDGEKTTKKKRKRCGECPGCLKKDNCGDCGPCKSVRSHQICKMRKCDQLKTKKEKVREVSEIDSLYSLSYLCFSFASLMRFIGRNI
jgi:hypothetical protein